MKAYIIVSKTGRIRIDYRGFYFTNKFKGKLQDHCFYGEKIKPCKIILIKQKTK